MERFNRESIKLILRYVPANDALSLRACSKKLNKLITESQLYWWYQNHIKYRKVHSKAFNRNCLYSYAKRCAAVNHILIVSDDAQLKLEQYMLDFPNHPDTRRNILISDYFHLIPHHFCDRPKHYTYVPILFGEYSVEETAEYNAVKDPSIHGYQMYHYLFKSFKNKRKQLQNLNAEKAQQEQLTIYDRIEALENEKRSLKRRLQLVENYAEEHAKLQNAPFHRKRVKSYHKKKEVSSLLKLASDI